MLDAASKGRTRGARGESNPAHKLTWRAANYLRYLYESGEYTFVELGQAFDVSREVARKIVRNKMWVQRAAN